MNNEMLHNLRCPDCFGDIKLKSISSCAEKEIIEGILSCSQCNSTYRILDGIPVLLPRIFSNVSECQLRKDVSEKASETIDKWESVYDIYHFRKLSHLRIRQQLKSINTIDKPKVLDIGIGWGVNYLCINPAIDLIGLDFSFESLLLLRKIYQKEAQTVPELICGSLSAIPIKNIKFDLVWSTQVFQHIPDNDEIKSSFNYISRELLKGGGKIVIDNLNWEYFRWFFMLVNFLKPNKKRKISQVNHGDNFYLKYYTKKDFKELVSYLNMDVKYRVSYTENLFHPELKSRPRSSFLASTDNLIQKMPFARLISRQISLILEKI